MTATDRASFRCSRHERFVKDMALDRIANRAWVLQPSTAGQPGTARAGTILFPEQHLQRRAIPILAVKLAHQLLLVRSVNGY